MKKPGLIGNKNGFKKGMRPWNQIGDIPLTRNQIGKRSRVRNPEMRKRIETAYRKNNPQKVAEWKRQFHLRKKSDPNYLIATNLRKRILKLLGRKKESGRNSAMDLLGCTANELRFYLEGKFKDGMNWSNHGNKGWHIDHIVPLAFFNLENEHQRKTAFHYTNLQPLWAHENLKKWAKLEFIK